VCLLELLKAKGFAPVRAAGERRDHWVDQVIAGASKSSSFPVCPSMAEYVEVWGFGRMVSWLQLDVMCSCRPKFPKVQLAAPTSWRGHDDDEINRFSTDKLLETLHVRST